MSIVDYEVGDVPDPGSAAQHLIHAAPVNPPGKLMAIPVELIVPAPGQRGLSDKWVGDQARVGWIDALGNGVCVNRVSVKDYPNRSSAFVGDSPDMRPEAVTALDAAKRLGSKFIYEVIIGQHRGKLANVCGLSEITAFVVENVSEEDCAQLFVQDARTVRPLRGYDIHQAAMVWGEPRALLIQAELDSRGIKLVPASAHTNQVSCIRALEKATGDSAVSAQHPDADLLRWHLDVLTKTFPGFQWPDALVQGLTFRIATRDITGIAPATLGVIAFKRWKGDVKRAVAQIRDMRQVTSSPNPQAASEIWEVLFDAAGIPLKVVPTKASAPRVLRRARATKAS